MLLPQFANCCSIYRLNKLTNVLTSPVADIIMSNCVQTFPIYRAARNCIMCARECILKVCVCVRARARVCMCVCVCVCVYV